MCALLIEYAVYAEHNVLSVLSRIAFKICLIISFARLKPVVLELRYVSFLVFIFFSDLLSLISYVDDLNLGYGIIASFFMMYAVLIYDGWKQFKVGRFNSVALSYALVMLINLALIVLQLKSLYAFLAGYSLIFAAQILYHFTLFVVVGVSVAYYLNSYSQKSMYYLMGGLFFVCADIINGAHFFYGIDRIVLIFSALMSAAGYYFFIGYFHQKEQSLLTEAELLLEIEKDEQSKRPAQG